MELVYEGKTRLLALQGRTVEAEEVTQWALEGSPSKEGRYEIRIRLQAEDNRYALDTVHFRLVHPDRLSPGSSSLVYQAEDGRRITRSHIVLRGSGAWEGGTQLIIGQPMLKGDQSDPWLQIGTDLGHSLLAAVTADAPRGSRIIEVGYAERIRPGMWVSVHSRNPDIVPGLIAPYSMDELSPRWTRIQAPGGVHVVEHHQVEAVEGNRITLIEPLMTDIKAGMGWHLTKYLNMNTPAGLVSDHGLKQVMGDVAERLVVSFPHVRFLLPSFVVSDDDDADVLLGSQLNDPATRLVKQVFDAAVTVTV